MIEAAALGVPTVAYDVAGLRDSVRDGETGWLVRDGETLADVVDRALKELADPVRRGRDAGGLPGLGRASSPGSEPALAMTALMAAELQARHGRMTRSPRAPRDR